MDHQSIFGIVLFSSLGKRLGRDAKGYRVLSKITDLISGENLKFYFIDSFGDGCFPFKLAWTSGILQNEFF